MSFLVTKFHLFDSKKSKGYSYFSIVCKNYYIQQSIKNYKKWGLSIEDSRGYYFNGPLRDTRKRKRVTFNPSYQSLEEQIYDELLPILTPSELRIKKPKHLKILEELRELLGQKNLQVHINNKKDLFERIRDDFIDEFDVSGYYDLLARINIQEEQLNELRRLGGKSLLRMKYDLHRSGLLTNNYVERIRELQRSEYFK